VERLLRQQAALAAFGSFAFRQTDLLSILNEAARVCAMCLGVNHAKVCQYRAAQDDLLIVAGVGWHAGIVGQVVSQANKSSPQGRAYVTGEPVICRDVETATDLKLPPFYAEHGIVSTVDVIVKGLEGPPFGVLEIDSTKKYIYDEHDVNFLTGFANVLAEAVATTSRVEVLRHAMEEMQKLVADKEQLLADKNILAEELQHRVRNNLQLVSGMLADQLRQTPDQLGKNGLRGILRRVTALAKVYDHLLGIGLSHIVDFAEYAKLLCGGLPELQTGGMESIVLTCGVAPILLDLGTTTALGLAVTELVANSYEHAFPDGVGNIIVAGGRTNRPGWGQLTVSDDGVGYKTSSESKRHGVGLVYRLMKQVSGSVEVHIGRGTTWVLAFPLSAGERDPVR
jgi:two-component sensor histidine kinase